jgi:hypothetical protein
MLFENEPVRTILHGHVTNSQNCFEVENLKERSFTFERTCFDITFVLGVGGGRLPCNLPKILTFLLCRTAYLLPWYECRCDERL